ncbi:hypothetical protein CBL_11062 [Carabus blaptoides fortunei]
MEPPRLKFSSTVNLKQWFPRNMLPMVSMMLCPNGLLRLFMPRRREEKSFRVIIWFFGGLHNGNVQTPGPSQHYGLNYEEITHRDKHTRKTHSRRVLLSLPIGEEFVIKFLSSFKLASPCYKFIAPGNGKQTPGLKDNFRSDWHRHVQLSYLSLSSK